MAWISAVLGELVALFVDDRFFAGAIVAWLAATGVARTWLGLPGRDAALLLVVGLVAILAESTLRRARRG